LGRVGIGQRMAARQLGFHSKPIGIVNVDGYYDSLILFVDRAIQEGFISTEDRRYLFVSEDPEQLIHDLSESVGPGFKGLVG
jgi:predicted Rossmann-fold nucleotide-binding protein